MAHQHDSCKQALASGGRVEGTPALLSEAAAALGYAVFPVDCDRAKSKSAVLRAIASAVDFPEYFGSDLDALLDCLTSTVLYQSGAGALVLLQNLHLDEPGVGTHLEAILETFSDAAEYVRDNGRVLAYACYPNTSLPAE